MADIADLKVQLNLSIGELRQLVALASLGNERLAELGQETYTVADDVGGLYFELMEQLSDAGAFGAEEG